MIKSFDDFNNSMNEGAEAGNPYGTLAVKMLWLRDQSHILHWQTNSFAEHQAFSEFYDTYLELVDNVMELIMGKMGRFTLGKGTIELQDYSKECMMHCLDEGYTIFTQEVKTVVPEEGNEEIHNMIEEITAAIDKLKYLLTLK